MSWSATELVNFSPASDAPRAIHTTIATLTARNRGQVVARVLHMLPAVQNLTLGYSRARWLDAELVVVPTTNSAGRSVIFRAAFTSDNAVPGTAETLNECPTCAFAVGGTADSLPPVFRFRLDFADSGTSPLIKPAPVELQRTAAAVSFGQIGRAHV